MAQYIKKEIVDLNGSKTTKAYYKLRTWRRLDFDEFVERKGLLKGVLMALSEHLAYEISNGYSVKIDGLGVFNAKLGVRKDKEMDGFEEGGTKRNAKSIEVTGVTFKADKELVREIDRNCNLERGGEERMRKPKLSKEARIKRARQFLKDNRYMRVSEYATITGLAYSTAARELCDIVNGHYKPRPQKQQVVPAGCYRNFVVPHKLPNKSDPVRHMAAKYFDFLLKW